jgi:hypothetical protein
MRQKHLSKAGYQLPRNQTGYNEAVNERLQEGKRSFCE